MREGALRRKSNFEPKLIQAFLCHTILSCAPLNAVVIRIILSKRFSEKHLTS